MPRAGSSHSRADRCAGERRLRPGPARAATPADRSGHRRCHRRRGARSPSRRSSRRDQGPSVPASPAPAVAVVAPSPIATQAPTAAPSTAAPVPSAIPPGWPDVASAVTPHDAWGVRAITVDQRPVQAGGRLAVSRAVEPRDSIGRRGHRRPSAARPTRCRCSGSPVRAPRSRGTSGSGGSTSRTPSNGSMRPRSTPSPPRPRCCSSARGRIAGTPGPVGPGSLPGRPGGRRRHPSHRPCSSRTPMVSSRRSRPGRRPGRRRPS